MASSSHTMTCCPQNGRGQGHVTLSNFVKMWQYLKTVQDTDMATMGE